MNSVNASYFKTHFGEVLSKARRGPVRVSRRGHDASIVMSEDEYLALKSRASRPSIVQQDALRRLGELACGPAPSEIQDPRRQAILDKHTQHHRSL